MENSKMVTKEYVDALWSKPGGTFAKITAFLAIIGLAYAFFAYALPFMLTVAKTGFEFMLYIAGCVVIGFILTSQQVHGAISLIWLQVMRKIYGWIVDINPISVLEKCIKDLIEKYRVISSRITDLKSIRVGMEKTLDEYQAKLGRAVKQRDQAMKDIEAAKDNKEALKLKGAVVLANNDIVRYTEFITSQKGRIAKSDEYIDTLEQLQTVCKFNIDNQQHQLDVLREDYKQAKSMLSGIGAIKAILNGCVTPSMEKEMALLSIANTVNQSAAEIDEFIDGSNDILTNFRINNEIVSEKADEIVKKYKSHGFAIFDEYEKTKNAPQISFAGTKNAGTNSDTDSIFS